MLWLINAKFAWNLSTACYQSPHSFLSFSLSLSLSLICCVNTLVCTILLRSNQCHSPQCFFYTSSSWPKFAYVANPVPPETRRVTYKLLSQRRSCFCFLYTSGTIRARHIRAILELWGWPFYSSLLYFFRGCYERNCINIASLSHFISPVHTAHNLFFIKPWMVAELT